MVTDLTAGIPTMMRDGAGLIRVLSSNARSEGTGCASRQGFSGAARALPDRFGPGSTPLDHGARQRAIRIAKKLDAVADGYCIMKVTANHPQPCWLEPTAGRSRGRPEALAA